MHALSGELDMRKMGGLRKKIPVTFWTFLIATLAIAGIPGLSGFFSKDEILWQAFSSSHGHFLLWLVAAVAAGMTAFYMFRALFMTFWGECRADEHVKHHIHESPKIMTVPSDGPCHSLPSLEAISVFPISWGGPIISTNFWRLFWEEGLSPPRPMPG